MSQFEALSYGSYFFQLVDYLFSSSVTELLADGLIEFLTLTTFFLWSRVVHTLSHNFRSATNIVRTPLRLPIKPDHVLVKIIYAGVNASDVSLWFFLSLVHLFFVGLMVDFGNFFEYPLLLINSPFRCKVVRFLQSLICSVDRLILARDAILVATTMTLTPVFLMMQALR